MSFATSLRHQPALPAAMDGQVRCVRRNAGSMRGSPIARSHPAGSPSTPASCAQKMHEHQLSQLRRGDASSLLMCHAFLHQLSKQPLQCRWLGRRGPRMDIRWQHICEQPATNRIEFVRCAGRDGCLSGFVNTSSRLNRHIPLKS